MKRTEKAVHIWMEKKNKLVKYVKPRIEDTLIEKAADMANNCLLKQGISQETIDIMRKSILELEACGLTPIDWSGKSDKSDN